MPEEEFPDVTLYLRPEDADKVLRFIAKVKKTRDTEIARLKAENEKLDAEIHQQLGERLAEQRKALDTILSLRAKNEELQKAFKKAIELRMDVRRKENGGIMAFGLVQLGLSAASLRDADMSYDVVDWLANRFWYPTSLATTHDPQSLFNVDLCGGLPAVIIRMLVTSQPGSIELLGALPKQWATGRIEGVPCRGQILVKSLVWNPQGVTVVLKSEIKQKVNLKVGGKVSSFTVKKGRAVISEAKPQEGLCVLSLPARSEVTLEIVR